MLMKGNTEDKNDNPILHFTSYLLFHKRLFYLSCLAWCTSGVGLQVLPFIDNSVLGSIFSFPAIFLSFHGVP